MIFFMEEYLEFLTINADMHGKKNTAKHFGKTWSYF